MANAKVQSSEDGLTDPLTVDEALKKLRVDADAKRALLGIPFPVFFFFAFVVMLYDHVMARSLYDQTHGIASILDSSGSDTITSDSKMKFRNIGELGDIFDWIVDTLVPAVLPPESTNQTSLEPSEWSRVALHNQVIGGVEIKFTWAALRDCDTKNFLKVLYPTCLDTTNTTTSTLLIPFDTNVTLAVQTLNDIRAEGAWLTRQTTQVLTTVTMFNGELQAYSVSVLKIDVQLGGFPELSSSTTTVRANPYKDKSRVVFDVVVMGCALISAARSIFEMLKHCRQRKLSDEQIIDYGWSLFEYTSTSAVFMFYVFWISILHVHEGRDFTDKVQLLATPGLAYNDPSPELFALMDVLDTLRSIASWTMYLRIASVVAVLGLGFNILSRFRFHPRLNILTRTVARALHQFVGFFVVFVTIFAAFAIAGAALFGDRVKEFSTLDNTIKSCINMLFGSFDISVIESQPYQSGALFYWSYMIVVALVLLNMMLAIVVDTYSAIREESEAQRKELNFMRTFAMIAFDCLHFVRTRVFMVSASNVVLLGRVIAFGAIKRALEAEADKTKVVTPATLAAMFPNGGVTPRVAAISFYFYFKRVVPLEKPKEAATVAPARAPAAEKASATVTTLQPFDAPSHSDRLQRLEEKMELLLQAIQSRAAP
ncbi:hypothetical protein PINS_up006100 [Pythium insidiosum]|nr:hypothetical protein PINS_up006100 [Pythium insidiosum]